MTKQTSSLLNELQAITECSFLSDLHNFSLKTKDKKAILEIPDDKYSLEAWSQAGAYISGKTFPFSTIQEVKAYIIDHD